MEEKEQKQNEERVTDVNKPAHGINWDDFKKESQYIKLEENKKCKLKVANARSEQKTFKNEKGEKEETMNLVFDVFKCNDVDYKPDEKYFSTRSTRLIPKLQPIVDKYGKNPFEVSIVKLGDGFDTQYHVEEL